ICKYQSKDFDLLMKFTFLYLLKLFLIQKKII
ncbi:hypothetical protein cco61_06628, partial [Campylobacter coli 1948]